MIASTCSRVRPVRRAIGFATDLATRPRIPVSEALPISTALSCAVMIEWLPRTSPFETNASLVRLDGEKTPRITGSQVSLGRRRQPAVDAAQP
jgi:hypothetical protein